MVSSDRNFKLLGLFFLALVLFNFPLLQLFEGKKLFWGIPPLLWYLFLCWGMILLGTAFITERSRKP